MTRWRQGLTEETHIAQRLAEHTEHMENVIQKYLRNQFPNIDAYNVQAGALAEPLRYVAMFDFPANVGTDAVRRLMSIACNGARCGVFPWSSRTRTASYPTASPGPTSNSA